MSVKNIRAVERYVEEIAAMNTALAELAEFVGSMPAPGDDGTLASLHYGHLGTVSELRKRIGQVEAIAAEMWTDCNYLR